MEKLKLTQYVEDELSASAMNKCRGGQGVSCKTTGCGDDIRVNVDKTLAVMRKLNPPTAPTDTTTTDTIVVIKDTLNTGTVNKP